MTLLRFYLNAMQTNFANQSQMTPALLDKVSRPRLAFINQMLSYGPHHHAFVGRFALIEGAYEEGKFGEMLEYVKSFVDSVAS